MENEKYDFYTYGMRAAKDIYTNIKQTAAEIGEKYGEQAKLEFESGIAAVIPTYATYFNNTKEPEIKGETLHTEDSKTK